MRQPWRSGRAGLAACTVAVGLTAALLVPPLAAADGGPVPPAPAPSVLPAINVAVSTAPAPTAAGISAVVTPLLNKRLGQESVVVIDPATSTVLFERDAATPRVPASTLKLATSAAALNVLGPQTRIPTVVYRNGATLYLVGGGDPTLVRAKGGDPLAGGSASLKALAKAATKTLTTGKTLKLVYDDSAFTGPVLGPGWPKGFPSAGVVAPVTALVVNGGRARPGSLTRVQDPARQAADEVGEGLGEVVL